MQPSHRQPCNVSHLFFAIPDPNRFARSEAILASLQRKHVQNEVREIVKSPSRQTRMREVVQAISDGYHTSETISPLVNLCIRRCNDYANAAYDADLVHKTSVPKPAGGKFIRFSLTEKGVEFLASEA